MSCRMMCPIPVVRQYAQNGHAPAATAVQAAELRHQVRRLSAHPAIVVWDGCNECQVVMNSSTEIYASFVLKVVAEEDVSRPIWPSCPSVGWAAGVYRLTSMPIPGKDLVTPDGGPLIETHRPKWHGDGFATVNGLTPLDPPPGPHPPCNQPPCNYQGLFPPNIPLNLTRQPTGPSEPNVFSSESPGASVMSSFESMSATLDQEHWGLHGGAPADTCSGSNFKRSCAGSNSMAQRNYPCDNFIAVFWGMQEVPKLNETGAGPFKRQLFQCMIAQALIVKQNIELTRATPRFGIIVWQFNEIWPTGGWGSVEYGNPAYPGQVIGGRFKPLHYWYRAALFTSVFATCDRIKGLCYVKNDSPVPFQGTVVINATSFASAVVTTIERRSISLGAGAGTIEWWESPAIAKLDPGSNVLEVIVARLSGNEPPNPTAASEGSATVSRNVVPLTTIEHMELRYANISTTPVRLGTASFAADLHCDAAAMFVTMTTLAHGFFQDNAMVLANKWP